MEPTGLRPGSAAGASSAVIESASGFPRVSRLSRRFTAFCGPALSYVPVDPTGPAVRAAAILASSGVKAAVVAAELAPALRAAWDDARPLPRLILVETSLVQTERECRPSRPSELSRQAPWLRGDAWWSEVAADLAPSPLLPRRDGDDLAYILFTSGSTGQPKGVMLSHANAFTFLDWCFRTLGPWRDDDRFASHAPFHFDLSVFDLFAACRNRATLVLVGETLGKDPAALGEFIAEPENQRLVLGADDSRAPGTSTGGLDRPGCAGRRGWCSSRARCFRSRRCERLRSLWPETAMWNLYGPTETNVCTACPIPATIPADRTEPFPIGSVCPPLRAGWSTSTARDVPPGSLGELLIAGPGVMRGYFGQPALTAAAFFGRGRRRRWYRTGDLVRDDGPGCFQFHGRRDRMVKKRGYRIELGEIESALYRHDGVDRAGVVAQADEVGVSIAAFVALKPDQKKSIIAMKRHCMSYLPPT